MIEQQDTVETKPVVLKARIIYPINLDLKLTITS